MNPEKKTQENRRHKKMSGKADPDTKHQSVQELANRFEAPGPMPGGEQSLQQGRGADFRERVQEHCSQQSKGEEDRERLVIQLEPEKCSVQERKKRFEGQRRTVEANTTWAQESFREKDLRQISQQIQALQTALQNMQGSAQPHLKSLRADIEKQLELFKMRLYKEDVSLDPDTAHPRLELSDDGKSVKDTGIIRKVPSKEKRFDSHLFVLAKEGYASGRHYWEVDVGKRSSWALGIARESVTRKGTLSLFPKNGFWVMGFTHGREYWAYTEPWTRLSVGGKLPKIGIFLDISAKQLSFYNVHKKAALHTFTIADGSSREGKFLPFFSTGPATAKPDTEPLKIVQGFADDE